MVAAGKKFHLIGHSLGAQIIGYAGNEVFRLTNQKVGRITGLDPAGPHFDGYSNLVRIDSTDGQFVDIIHTDGPGWFGDGLGTGESAGHVDFYPNGGTSQPGCLMSRSYGWSWSRLLDRNGRTIERQRRGGSLSCSHNRAREYFTNSIKKCRYNPADGNKACTMGYHVSKSFSGKINIETTGKAPYCNETPNCYISYFC